MVIEEQWKRKLEWLWDSLAREALRAILSGLQQPALVSLQHRPLAVDPQRRMSLWAGLSAAEVSWSQLPVAGNESTSEHGIDCVAMLLWAGLSDPPGVTLTDPPSLGLHVLTTEVLASTFKFLLSPQRTLTHTEGSHPQGPQWQRPLGKL
ncbi:hypothetical protein AAY473_040622 [Plecturocebus cupreus]